MLEQAPTPTGLACHEGLLEAPPDPKRFASYVEALQALTGGAQSAATETDARDALGLAGDCTDGCVGTTDGGVHHLLFDRRGRVLVFPAVAESPSYRCGGGFDVTITREGDFARFELRAELLEYETFELTRDDATVETAGACGYGSWRRVDAFVELRRVELVFLVDRTGPQGDDGATGAPLAFEEREVSFPEADCPEVRLP